MFIYLLMSLIILCMLFIIYYISHKNKSLKKRLSQRIKSITHLFKEIEEISRKRISEHKRVRELEDAINGAFNVSIRKEVTEVKSEFTKLEMVIMISGVSLLLERTNNTDDAQHYIDLINKIEKYLKDMKEKDSKIIMEGKK